MPILLKLFQKIAEEGTHFQTDSTRAPSPDTKTKDNTQKRKLQVNITDEHRCKILNTILANNSATHQKAHTP